MTSKLLLSTSIGLVSLQADICLCSDKILVSRHENMPQWILLGISTPHLNKTFYWFFFLFAHGVSISFDIFRMRQGDIL